MSWTVALYDWVRVGLWPLLVHCRPGMVCRSCLQLLLLLAAFLVMAFLDVPARCLVGQMPHATFVGALRMTIKYSLRSKL